MKKNIVIFCVLQNMVENGFKRIVTVYSLFAIVSWGTP